MRSYIASSILSLHQLKVGRNDAPLMPHSNQILCLYKLYQGTDIGSLFFSLGGLAIVAKDPKVYGRRPELTIIVLAAQVR